MENARIRAVIPVHLFGLCCEMDAIMKIARENNLLVIEDAAQAIGAEYPGANGWQEQAQWVRRVVLVFTHPKIWGPQAMRD